MYARDYRQIARNNLEGNWVNSALVALVAAVLGGILIGSSFTISIDAETLSYYVTEDALATLTPFILLIGSFTSTLSFAQLVLGGVVSLGFCTYLLQQYDHSAPLEFKTLFSRFDLFSKGFFLNLLKSIFIILWSMLFIIPGIVKSYSYAMANFIMAENPHLTPKEAITASRKMMDGHKWQLFCLSFSFIGWTFLSCLTLGIGFLFLNPYMNAAYAAFYRQLCADNNASGNDYRSPAEL